MSTHRNIFLRLWTNNPADADVERSGEKQDDRKHITVTSTSDTSKSRNIWWRTDTEQVEAVGDERFWVHNGSILSNLKELHDALLEMTDEQYMHHTSNGNDFSAWVRDVLHNKECADALENAQTRREAADIISQESDHV